MFHPWFQKMMLSAALVSTPTIWLALQTSASCQKMLELMSYLSVTRLPPHLFLPQGLLKVAVENARVQDKQIQAEKRELKMELYREREMRESLERQLTSELQSRGPTDAKTDILHAFLTNDMGTNLLFYIQRGWKWLVPTSGTTHK